MSPNRSQRRALQAANSRFPAHLQEIPRSEWPRELPSGIQRVWRSREFLVQLYLGETGHRRLSVNRTRMLGSGRWDDAISWDDLQRLKCEAGFGAMFAVEVYPADADVVNVANMRHLWIMDEAPAFAWRRDA